MLALSTDFTRLTSGHVAECPDLGPACAGPRPPAPYRHELVNYAYGATLDVQYGVARWLSVALTLPFRALTTRVRYTDLEGRDYAPEPPDTHHASRTLTGLGDPTLTLSVGRALGRLGFSVRLGAMLPFGRKLDADPFALGREGVAHEHVQFGVGVVRPIVGSALGYDFGAVGVDGWFLAVLALTDSSLGYRPGQRLAGGAQVTSALGASKARFGLGAELSHESTETWGRSQMGDGNLGRTDVLAVALVRWSPLAHAGFFGALKVPVYVDAVGAQLSYPFVVQLGVATAIAP